MGFHPRGLLVRSSEKGNRVILNPLQSGLFVILKDVKDLTFHSLTQAQGSKALEDPTAKLSPGRGDTQARGLAASPSGVTWLLDHTLGFQILCLAMSLCMKSSAGSISSIS